MEIEKIRVTINPNLICTMNCGYCFFKEDKTKRMNLEQLEKGIKKIQSLFEGKNIKRFEIHFNSHDVMLQWGDLLKPFISNHPEFIFSIHSNGLLLFDDRLDFMKKHSVALVISLDGPQYVQDINRLSKNGKTTYPYVYRNIQKAKERNLRLRVVSTFNDKSIKYVYDVFKYHIKEKNNFKFLFDVTRSNYIGQYEEIDSNFQKIAKYYISLPEQDRKLFKDIESILKDTEIPCYHFSLSRNALKLKHHRHSFQQYGEWNDEIQDWIMIDDPVTENNLIYTAICGCNTELCKICPAYKGIMYEKNNFNYSLYCRLFRPILKELKLI